MIRFTKMQGCGNDYIYIDGTQMVFHNKPELVQRLSDRHFGIGADGVIFINPSGIADFEMEMYNADGSRGRMCGNGIRCVAKYVFDNGLTDHNPMTIESFGSVKTLSLELSDGKVSRVTVDMGEPCLQAERIPADPAGFMENTDAQGRLIDVPVMTKSTQVRLTAVSMGNPHAVIFVEDTKGVDLLQIGPEMEHSDAFPEGVNTEFVQVIDDSHLRMRVWERGSGETLACGTGACASVVAAVLNGKTQRKVCVQLLGGELLIHWDETDGHVYMTGPAETVFTGTVDIE